MSERAISQKKHLTDLSKGMSPNLVLLAHSAYSPGGLYKTTWLAGFSPSYGVSQIVGVRLASGDFHGATKPGLGEPESGANQSLLNSSFQG